MLHCISTTQGWRVTKLVGMIIKAASHMLRFDHGLACVVSKRKVRWSVCGIKTTDLVSLSPS